MSHMEFVTLCRLLGLDENCNKISEGMDISGYDMIIIDEFCTTPTEVIELFYFKTREFTGKIGCCGHTDQNGYILKSGYKYEYFKCEFFKEMCGYTKFVKEPVIGKCRFRTQRDIDILNYLEIYGVFPEYFKPKIIDPTLKSNICFTNKKRREINGLFNSEICIEDRIKVVRNGDGYFKGERMICKTIENGIVNGLYPLKDLDLAYCNTSHENQGLTFDEPTNVYEWNLMSDKIVIQQRRD